MFSLYPSNKLEHLVELLNGLLNAQPSGVFEQELILVENPGMQHWLHLNLAQRNSISMNLNFPLTSRFVWNIARVVLGNDSIPSHSPYRREVLRFRIASLLNDEALLSAPEFSPVLHYWKDETNHNQQALRKLTLAIDIADAFEQYILFRPHWLAAWEKGDDLVSTPTSQWQSLLWRKLVEQEAWHPANLLALTANKLNELADKTSASEVEPTLAALPKRITLFAVNALAPSLLHFFDALAKHCNIHFFYLNPSVSYWGDIKSDKANALLLRKAQFDKSASGEQANRLLANLGQHGRDLLNRLTQLETFEISAFDIPSQDEAASKNLLNHLQNGVYQGIDTQRLVEEVYNQTNQTRDIPTSSAQTLDSSAALGASLSTGLGDNLGVTLVSCHTALRELQVLHDYLLKRMTADASLMGKDIIVLCPAIEDYAPYIYSVFAKPYESIPYHTEHNNKEKIRCSVSDRSVLNTDPHVSAFLNLLALPDSRFSVTSILGFLDNSDIASQFNINADGIEKITHWLNVAAVRWGLNAQHKQHMANLHSAGEQNTWEWGLQRLLTSLVASDHAQVIDEWLTVPDIEGLDSVLLGDLITFLLFLQKCIATLNTPRSIEMWVEQLTIRCEEVFLSRSTNAPGIDIIYKALSDLQLQAQQAQFTQDMSIGEVTELLTMAFSAPDVRNQFLTGHVTFCSMMPMRSVPFNTVAVLGLNDGQFPRKNNQNSTNLMSMLGAEPGDRSRSQEDRYLFLEAILSAREALYLSYQGANSRDNTERQPSTVLSLFQQELELLSPSAAKYVQHPLHHFSAKNYQAPLNAVNQGGYRLALDLQNQSQSDLLDIAPSFSPSFAHEPVSSSLSHEWNIADIAHCFQNPLAYFAKQRLGVNLELKEAIYDDDEPFDVDRLTQFSALNEASHGSIDDVITQLKLSGNMPDSIIAEKVYEQWETALQQLYSVLPENINEIDWQPYRAEVLGLSITAESRIVGVTDANSANVFGIVDFHLGSQTAKRKVFQWLRHLIVNQSVDIPCASQVFYLDWKKDGEVKCVTYAPVDKALASQYLQQGVACFIESLTQPSLLHARSGEAMARAKKSPENTWHTHLQGNDQLPGIVHDPYFKWMFTAMPNEQQQSAWQEQLIELYSPMVNAMKESKVSL